MRPHRLFACTSALLFSFIACSSSSTKAPGPVDGGTTTSDAEAGGGGGGGGGGGDMDGGSMTASCSGTYSGAVSGTDACSVTIFIGNELDLSGKLSGSDVEQSWGMSMKFLAAPEAKTYALADMKQVDTQIIDTAVNPSKSFDLHYDGSGAAPAGFMLEITDATAPHGTLSAVLTSSADATTVNLSLTF